MADSIQIQWSPTLHRTHSHSLPLVLEDHCTGKFLPGAHSTRHYGSPNGFSCDWRNDRTIHKAVYSMWPTQLKTTLKVGSMYTMKTFQCYHTVLIKIMNITNRRGWRRQAAAQALECARVALLYNLLYLSLDCITSRDRL